MNTKHLIVTTPRSERENSAAEAADVLKNGGGWYFRYIGQHAPNFDFSTLAETRLYYVLDGYVRGYAVISSVDSDQAVCETTGRSWPPGYYIKLDARTWKWIEPIEMRGFQGWRYFQQPVKVIGDWRDPMPPRYVHYRGFTIDVSREESLGGWENLYYSVFRDRDGLEMTSGFEDSAEKVHDFAGFMRERIDAFLALPLKERRDPEQNF